MTALNKQLDTLKTIVPEDKETDEFMRLLQGAAAASGVQIRKLDRAGRWFRATITTRCRLRFRWTARITTSWISSRGLSRLSRIINVGDLKFAGLGGGQGAAIPVRPSTTVTGTCTITTFFTLAARPPRRPQAEAAAARQRRAAGETIGQDRADDATSRQNHGKRNLTKLDCRAVPGGCRDARSGATVAIRSDQVQSLLSQTPQTGGSASSSSEPAAGASASASSQAAAGNRQLPDRQTPAMRGKPVNRPGAGDSQHPRQTPNAQPPAKPAAPQAKAVSVRSAGSERLPAKPEAAAASCVHDSESSGRSEPSAEDGPEISESGALPAIVPVTENISRRDPFDPLVARKRLAAGPAAILPPGKPGLVIATLRVDGIVQRPQRHDRHRFQSSATGLFPARRRPPV